MTRNLLIALIFGIILLFIIGYYFISARQDRNTVIVDAGGAHVEIGSDGMTVSVENEDGLGTSVDAGRDGVRVEETEGE